MTTIIVDTLEKKVYADRQCTNMQATNQRGFVSTLLLGEDFGEHTILHKDICKVYKIQQSGGVKDFIFAGCGDADFNTVCCSTLINEDPLPIIPEDSDVSLVMMLDKGNFCEVYLYEVEEIGIIFKKRRWKRTLLSNNIRYHTFGSGSVFAKGALYTGVGIEDVFNSVSLCDPYTSSNYDEVSL